MSTKNSTLLDIYSHDQKFESTQLQLQKHSAMVVMFLLGMFTLLLIFAAVFLQIQGRSIREARKIMAKKLKISVDQEHKTSKELLSMLNNQQVNNVKALWKKPKTLASNHNNSNEEKDKQEPILGKEIEEDNESLHEQITQTKEKVLKKLSLKSSFDQQTNHENTILLLKQITIIIIYVIGLGLATLTLVFIKFQIPVVNAKNTCTASKGFSVCQLPLEYNGIAFRNTSSCTVRWKSPLISQCQNAKVFKITKATTEMKYDCSTDAEALQIYGSAISQPKDTVIDNYWSNPGYDGFCGYWYNFWTGKYIEYEFIMTKWCIDTIDPSWKIDGLSFKNHNVEVSSIRTTLPNGYLAISENSILPMNSNAQVGSNSIFVVTEDENYYNDINCDAFGCTLTPDMTRRMFDKIGMPDLRQGYYEQKLEANLDRVDSIRAPIVDHILLFSNYNLTIPASNCSEVTLFYYEQPILSGGNVTGLYFLSSIEACFYLNLLITANPTPTHIEIQKFVQLEGCLVQPTEHNTTGFVYRDECKITHYKGITGQTQAAISHNTHIQEIAKKLLDETSSIFGGAFEWISTALIIGLIIVCCCICCQTGFFTILWEKMVACFKHKVDTSTRLSNSEFVNDLANENILIQRQLTKKIPKNLKGLDKSNFINQSNQSHESSEDDDEVGPFSKQQKDIFRQKFENKSLGKKQRKDQEQ